MFLGVTSIVIEVWVFTTAVYVNGHLQVKGQIWQAHQKPRQPTVHRCLTAAHTHTVSRKRNALHPFKPAGNSLAYVRNEALSYSCVFMAAAFFIKAYSTIYINSSLKSTVSTTYSTHKSLQIKMVHASSPIRVIMAVDIYEMRFCSFSSRITLPLVIK